MRRRAAAARARGCGAPAPGAGQPRRQRREVHRARRGHVCGWSRAHGGRRACACASRWPTPASASRPRIRRGYSRSSPRRMPRPRAASAAPASAWRFRGRSSSSWAGGWRSPVHRAQARRSRSTCRCRLADPAAVQPPAPLRSLDGPARAGGPRQRRGARAHGQGAARLGGAPDGGGVAGGGERRVGGSDYDAWSSTTALLNDTDGSWTALRSRQSARVSRTVRLLSFVSLASDASA